MINRKLRGLLEFYKDHCVDNELRDRIKDSIVKCDQAHAILGNDGNVVITLLKEGKETNALSMPVNFYVKFTNSVHIYKSKNEILKGEN